MPSWPSLRGFGNTVVQPLGKCSVNIEIDEAKARVILLVVPDHFLNEALLIGRSFTEQPHIIVEKDSVFLRILSDVTYKRTKIDRICIEDTKIDGLTLIDFKTEPLYSGEVYIEGSNRLKFDQEHYLVQGLFTVVDGFGSALVKSLTKKP